MDPPLEPPFRVTFTQQALPLQYNEAQQNIQRFIDHCKAPPAAWQDADVKSKDEPRGTSTIVLGQLQRLSDALAKEA